MRLHSFIHIVFRWNCSKHCTKEGSKQQMVSLCHKSKIDKRPGAGQKWPERMAPFLLESLLPGSSWNQKRTIPRFLLKRLRGSIGPRGFLMIASWNERIAARNSQSRLQKRVSGWPRSLRVPKSSKGKVGSGFKQYGHSLCVLRV